MFLSELCDVLGVQRPEPAGAERAHNDYVFERAVRPRASDGGTAPKRIDLYKRGSFILEAKQSRTAGRDAAPTQLSLLPEEPTLLGKRTPSRGWDVMMQNARRQAEDYVFLLDTDHAAPPFIVLCDVGHCLELYADFSGTGRAYNQFPDRKGFRIFMDDLRDPKVREKLAAVWTDPLSLDPARESARVTREIAKRLADVSKALEEKKADPEHVAHFLMRCLFTMFAEDTDLLPKGSFQMLLQRCVEDPAHFRHRLQALWKDMETGADFNPYIEDRVRHFNGGLFKDTTVFDLGPEEIGELLAAAKADWKLVDPAIFGTLLEQALSPEERKKLGAHYTPRAYVQRLVDVTVMEPLRADWQAALTRAEQAKDDGKPDEAIAQVRAFYHQLCTTRILDPACGTGNFLYVSLELMKKLEGEVLQTLSDLGDAQASLALQGESVDPHQFLGLELNPRAAAIAELVIWIGYLQWHYRNYTHHPNEPILRAFKNINWGRPGGFDSVLTWDGYPIPRVELKEGERVETLPNARQPLWPDADFIVGNPPFISNREMRELLSDPYVDCLKPAYSEFTQAADFVLFFWIHAARAKSVRRIGFVSTSRIRMKQNNEVFRNALGREWHVRFAIPDHDWPSDNEGAKIRVAFATVDREAGESLFVLAPDHDLVSSAVVPQDADYMETRTAYIGPNLSIGPNPLNLVRLNATDGICHAGVKPYAINLLIKRPLREHLFLDPVTRRKYSPKFMNGHDVGQSWRGFYVIDVNDLSEEQLRQNLPNAYGYILEQVKPGRMQERNPRLRSEFWKFEANRTGMRDALIGLNRYLVTLENSPQRYFTFIESNVLPDQKLRVIATNDGYVLSVLSSRAHEIFSVTFGGRAGKANTPVYNTECFTQFPFPAAEDSDVGALRALGDELDATRKRVLADHPDLTLTGLYNLLEKIKSGAPLSPIEEDVKHRGLVLILKELHEQIDALTAQAYGWPPDLSDEQILERLVALNAERAREEAAGHVRWLRPEYQIPRFAKGAAAKTGELDLGETVVAIDKGLPAFPKDRYEQPLAIEALLAASGRAMTAAELARGFKKGGKRIEQRVTQVLDTLARYGRVTALPNGAFSARRAA